MRAEKERLERGRQTAKEEFDRLEREIGPITNDIDEGKAVADALAEQARQREADWGDVDLHNLKMKLMALLDENEDSRKMERCFDGNTNEECQTLLKMLEDGDVANYPALVAEWDERIRLATRYSGVIAGLAPDQRRKLDETMDIQAYCAQLDAHVRTWRRKTKKRHRNARDDGASA